MDVRETAIAETAILREGREKKKELSQDLSWSVIIIR